MNWPTYDADGRPVVVNAPPTRPVRGRRRHHTDGPVYQNMLYDRDGFLIPASSAVVTTKSAAWPAHRSSTSVAMPRPTSVVINNAPWEEHSAVSSQRRRSSHGIDYIDYGSDIDDVDAHYHPGTLIRTRRGSHSRARSRATSPHYDPEFERKLVKLERLEKEEEKKLERERFEQEQLINAEKKRRKEQEEKDLKVKWIAEWKVEEEAKKEKEKKAAKEAEEKHREWAIREFGRAGYSEDSVERILKAADVKKNKEKSNDRSLASLDPNRPTYVRVGRKHLDPVTLDAFRYPWMVDSKDKEYLVIKQWLPDDELQLMFDHTTRLRERAKLDKTSVELRKDHGAMHLVSKRGKSGARSRSHSRSWMFT